MQDTARPTTGAVLEHAELSAVAQQLAAFAVPSAAAETFRCVECSRSLPASMLAFETGAARGEGVCLTCDAEQYTGGGDVWPLGIVAAAADDSRYSLMGREVL